MSSADVFKRAHLGLTVFWGLNALAVVVVFLWLPDFWKQLSVLYLVIVSIYANMATHWGAYQASRAEVRVEQTEEVNAEHATVAKADRVEQDAD